jgi:proline iminopeptidase
MPIERALALLAVAIALSVPDAPQAQPAISEGYVRVPDGPQLFYRKVGGAGRAAILLHGGPGSNINAVWPDLMPLAQGRTIIMYDQRGGGRSQVIRDPSQLTAAHHVADLEAVRTHFGLPKFTLIGESWGAGLAVLYAAQYPDRVERLLLIGPMPPTRAILERRMDESDMAMAFRERLSTIAREMPGAKNPVAACREFFSLYTKQFFFRPEAINQRRGSSCDAPPEGVRNYFVVNAATLASLGAFDFRPTLARLHMPAMVVEGERSIPSTVESARVFAQSLANATLVLIPDAGHYPQVERPDVFFPTVKKFLESGPQPPH